MYLVRPGIVVIAVLAMTLLAAACDDDGETVRGSGSVITEEMAFADFTSVDASNAFEVDIVQSATFSISIRVDDNVLDLLDVSKEGDTLKLGLESGVSLTNTTLEASITMPTLEGLHLSGASKANVSGFRSSGTVDINASGASRAILEGSATELTISGSGASNLDLGDFTVDTAEVKLSGASEATVNVRERIDPVDVSGASRLRYLGDPSLENVTTSGASTVEKGD
jgi:hypothetical protein